jgi:hypothetical protein
VEGPIKKKQRVLADLAGAYGINAARQYRGRDLNGEELYALWLLRRRILLQRASAASLASHAGQLPLEWFDAVCDWPEQAKEEQYRVNSDRKEAAFMAKQRRRG